jgi:hypothetical protein
MVFIAMCMANGRHRKKDQGQHHKDQALHNADQDF